MDLSVKLYRIESQRLKSSEIYYLVKDVRVGDTAAKVRVKLGYIKPDPENEAKLTTTPSVDLELKAIEARLGKTPTRTSHLTPAKQREVEETRYWIPLFKLFLSPSEYEQIETLHETEYIAGTTAIEGNTLTVQQVDDLLHKGISPQGKSLREQLEVTNAERATRYRQGYAGRVTFSLIKRLHSLTLENINDQAGSFRRIDSIGIVGEDYAVAPAIQIESMLGKAIRDYYDRVKAGGHPFEKAVIFHERFEMIHPFIDGNGRVGREVLRHMLARAGYPDILIGRGDREKYLDALRAGHRGEVDQMVKMFSELLLKDKRAGLFREILSRKARAVIG
jgi:Fic family protein